MCILIFSLKNLGKMCASYMARYGSYGTPPGSRWAGLRWRDSTPGKGGACCGLKHIRCVLLGEEMVGWWTKVCLVWNSSTQRKEKWQSMMFLFLQPLMKEWLHAKMVTAANPRKGNQPLCPEQPLFMQCHCPQNQTSVYSHLPVCWKYREEREVWNKTSVMQGPESRLGETLQNKPSDSQK